jgi:hypothetical protein
MLQKTVYALIGLATLGIIGYALWMFFSSSDIHLLIRIAFGIIAAGILILLGIAIRDRIVKMKKEDFKEVDN